MRRVAVMWFRRDLRLGDNQALAAAVAENDQVVPLFVVDPRFATSGAPRRAFLHDCLVSLDAAIRDVGGSGLVIRRGDPSVVVPGFAHELDAGTVYVSRDFGPYGRRRDQAVSLALRGAGRHLRGVGSPYAVDPGVVRKADDTAYAVFTPFAKAWRRSGWDPPRPTPPAIRWALIDMQSDPLYERSSPGCVLPAAGESAALDRWREFTLGGGLENYDDRRDMPAVDGTSRLSPALKWGTIHPRRMLADVDTSGSKFADELAWREFYADVLYRQPHTGWSNVNQDMDDLPVDTDRAARGRFDRWCAGTTGFGIVDAGMRQLAATGWMHNRVRMIVASFLVKDLHLPWQWGAKWFMQHLVDGDLASNSHGWQWTAGTGTDAAPYFRVFNPRVQQERFDPTGEFVDRWVPDRVPPMLDHAVERDEALRRLKSRTQ
jgi:deoxyribodipyrimidine photo-lyase